jgi:hypothetical protein
VKRLLAPLALLLLAHAAAADTFVLKDGATVDGEILRTFSAEGGRVDRWEVRTRAGVRVVSAADVTTRKPGGGPYPWRTFEERFALVFPKDPEDNYKLGVWAREQGLEAEAIRAFRRALDADPDHLKTRTALGHQRVGESWVVPPGQATVPEERGAALPADTASPFEAILGKALAKRESANFRVESSLFDQPALGRLLDALERAREGTYAFLGEPPAAGGARPTYLLVRDAAEYRSVVDAVVAPALERRADGARFLALCRAGHLAPLAAAPGGCVAWPADESQTASRAFLAHFAVHEIWRMEIPAGSRDPDWLREALAYGVLNDLFPDDPTYCVDAGYGRGDSARGAWRNTRTWGGAAREMAAAGKALSFADLAVLDQNSLSFDALIQAWSVLQTLRAKDENGTRAFVRKVRRGSDAGKALQECLRLDPAGVDRLWRTEVMR